MRRARGQDAFGQALWDGLQRGREGRIVEIVERDDGYIDLSAGIADTYLQSPDELREGDRVVVDAARGRVLDVGCGGGRHALAMQQSGCDVVAVDVSPLAVETARARGVRDARVLDIAAIDMSLGRFDTITMLGNNFGLFGSRPRAVRLLRGFAGLLAEGGQVLAQSLDVYQTDNPDHRAYHERNLRRGRMAGQIRMRVRYRTLKTAWFDYLMVSRAEMSEIAAEAGWRIDHILTDHGPSYCARLVRTGE